jgi:hypothetical protein
MISVDRMGKFRVKALDINLGGVLFDSWPGRRLFFNCFRPSFQDNIAGIAQSVYRRATGWLAGVRFPAGARFFSSVQPPMKWVPA